MREHHGLHRVPVADAPARDAVGIACAQRLARLRIGGRIGLGGKAQRFIAAEIDESFVIIAPLNLGKEAVHSLRAAAVFGFKQRPSAGQQHISADQHAGRHDDHRRHQHHIADLACELGADPKAQQHCRHDAREHRKVPQVHVQHRGRRLGRTARAGGRLRRVGVADRLNGPPRRLGAQTLHRVVLGVIAHQHRILSEQVGRGRAVVGKHDQQEGLGRVDHAAVRQIRVIDLRIKPVLVGDGIAVLVPAEVVGRLRLEHGVEDIGEAVGVLVEVAQTGDHLPRGKEVVLIEGNVHRVGILAHIGRDQLPIIAIAADGVPEGIGKVVVGVDDRAAHQRLILDAEHRGRKRHFAVCDALAVDHVQRHLVHAAHGDKRVPVDIVLLAGHGVVVADADLPDLIGAIAVEKLVGHLFPGFPVKARIALRRGAGQQRRQQHEHDRSRQKLSHSLHKAAPKRKDRAPANQRRCDSVGFQRIKKKMHIRCYFTILTAKCKRNKHRPGGEC